MKKRMKRRIYQRKASNKPSEYAKEPVYYECGLYGIDVWQNKKSDFCDGGQYPKYLLIKYINMHI